MYKTDNIPNYSEFKYWFLRREDGSWSTVYRATEEEVTDTSADDIKLDFENFKLRPEYIVGEPVTAENFSLLQDKYERLLLGAQLISWRARLKATNSLTFETDIDVHIPNMMKCVEWLRGTDFFVAPASTQYHNSYDCGLLDHTIEVYNNMLSLVKIPKFKTISIDRATIVCLVHDWCKIGLYEKYMKNVKNEQTNKWESQPAYRHNQTGIPLGHGVSSMFLASKFFKLSTDEALAIRWHMGEYNVADNEMNELHKANEVCPMVFLIQFADRLSITNY